MVENPYFQFPLCALAFGETVDERLNTILDYSLIDKGRKLFHKLTAEEQRQFLSKARQARKLPIGFDGNLWTHRAALYGAEIIGIILGGFLLGIERYHKLDEFVKAFEETHGPDAIVRIKKGWLFKARDERGLTYREFSVLCGIFSAIGEKEMARVTQPRIRRCAMGYRTEAIMQEELPRRTDKAQPLTERRLRDTIERLHRNKFFARSTVARRLTYYSIRLDGEALRKKLLDKHTYQAFHRATQSAQDQALTDDIKRLRREIAARTPKTSPAMPRLKFTPPVNPH